MRLFRTLIINQIIYSLQLKEKSTKLHIFLFVWLFDSVFLNPGFFCSCYQAGVLNIDSPLVDRVCGEAKGGMVLEMLKTAGTKEGEARGRTQSNVK